jgi:hypothetical protein
VRDLFGERRRTEHAVGETEDRLAVPLVEGEESRLVAAAGSVQEFLVGHQWPGRAEPPALSLWGWPCYLIITGK